MKILSSTVAIALGLAAMTMTTTAPAKADTPFVAEISWFAGNFAPRGWAFCDGSLLAIATHTALFSLVGTTYGGDGRTTFALPDMRGRAPMEAGRGPGLTPVSEGEKKGQEATTMTLQTLANHTHTVSVRSTSTAAATLSPTNSLLAGAQTYSALVAPNVSLNSTSLVVTEMGGGQSVNNMEPSLALNCIIALEGVYPSRS